ncbi:MAG: hypothetical protein PHE61_04400 [Candidatus Omnitrophica bacterium]|nr:hypothetical protein [Candidatus Omnitrophota bacterium]
MGDQFDDLVPDEEEVDEQPLYLSMCESEEQKIHLVRQNLERYNRDVDRIAKVLQASTEEIERIIDEYGL